MNCPHNVREQIYSGDECPACLASDRDKLQSQLSAAEQRVCEFGKHLKYVMTLAVHLGPAGTDVQRQEALHMLGGTLKEASDLLSQSYALSSDEPQEDCAKVADQQVDVLTELETWLEYEASHMYFAAARGSFRRVLDRIHSLKSRRTHVLRNPHVCDKCGYIGPISHPHPRKVGEGTCNYAAVPAPEPKCICENPNRITICPLHPFTVNLNGRGHPVGSTLSYEDAVRISRLVGADLYTVTYTIIGENRGGTLIPGQSVNVEAGMSVDVCYTGNA